MKFSCLICFNYEEFLPNLTICCFPEPTGSLGQRSMASLDSILALYSQVLTAQHMHQGQALHVVQLLLTHLQWEIPLLSRPKSIFLYQLLSYTSAILPSLKIYLVPRACFQQLASWDIHWLTAGIHFAEMSLHWHLIPETKTRTLQHSLPVTDKGTSGSATISSHTST